jgi:hypothetical protein
VTAKPANTTAAWENPLMPNARLRQIYLAMMQSRAVARVRPGKRGERSTLGLEACLVSPAVDLGPGDLVSDVLTGATVEFLRTAPSAGSKSKRRLSADCGLAGRLPGAAGSFERVWTAVGAAAALKSLAAGTKSEDGTAAQVDVVVLYLLPDELPSTVLQKVLSFARDQKLPLLLVALPPARVKAGAASPYKAGKIGDLALRCGVPAIPTDADDAVAIYRVAQESIGHARIGGGPALIECIPFVLPATATKRTVATDAIAVLEQYMLPRNVVTRSWIDRETKAFAKRLANEKAAFK